MKSKFIILLLVLPLIFSGCSEKSSIPYYLSITVDSSNVTGESDKSVYYYDFDKKLKKIKDLDDLKESSLALYDKSSDRIYYISGNDENKELYSFDLKNKKTSQITQNCHVKDYFTLSEDKVYFLGLNNSHYKPMIYSKDTSEIEILSEDTDLTFDCIAYDVSEENLYAVGTLLKDFQESVNKSDEDEIVEYPPHYVYEFYRYLNNSEQLFSTYDTAIKSLICIPGYREFFYKENDYYGSFSYVRKYIYKIDEEWYYQQSNESPPNPEVLSETRNHCFLNRDEVLFIGENSSNLKEYPEGVYLYNSETEELKLLFTIGDKKIIDFQLLPK